ncbi:hypothetical protein BGW80DRAFT_929564 [Lactifluus volemus]|nr:hypothetical protein BGW80DRAFT_929564 [Lactifluus volemus]
MSLFTFPTEILIKILCLLKARDIVAFSGTCHHLQSIVVNTPILQYIIYMNCAGLEDDLRPGLAIPDRYARLRRWEAAWNNLDGMAPSVGRFEFNDLQATSSASMLRDGFLIVPYKKRGLGGIGRGHYCKSKCAGFAMMDLRSPDSGFRTTRVDGDLVAFDVSIEQNMVAMLKLNSQIIY